MPRPPRIQQPEAWYHVIARGIERRAIFRQERDYQHFLELLERSAERFAWNISAYVLMPNHFHLFLQTLQPNLSRSMQWLTTSYAAWFNTRYRRCGHLFQGRFKAVLVNPQEWALGLTRYIHLNPVRVQGLGLGKDARIASRAGVAPAAPAETVQQRLALLRAFRWSSYRAYSGHEPGPKWLQKDWVMARCGRNANQRGQGYRDYCESAVRDGMADSFAPPVLNQVCLGSREFLERVLGVEGQPSARAERPGFAEIQKAIENARREPWKQSVNRRGDWARGLALYLMRENGHGLGEAAAAVGLKRAPTAGMAIRRFQARLQTDKTLGKILHRIERALDERKRDL